MAHWAHMASQRQLCKLSHDLHKPDLKKLPASKGMLMPAGRAPSNKELHQCVSQNCSSSWPLLQGTATAAPHQYCTRHRMQMSASVHSAVIS